jgi:hypothetical protein
VKEGLPSFYFEKVRYFAMLCAGGGLGPLRAQIKLVLVVDPHMNVGVFEKCRDVILILNEYY